MLTQADAMSKHASVMAAVAERLSQPIIRDPSEPPVPTQEDEPVSLVGDLMGALIVTVLEITKNISGAFILLGDWPPSFLYLLLLHVTFGNILSQAMCTATTGLPGLMAVAGFENLAILQGVRMGLSSSMAGASPEAQLVTFVAISTLSSVVGAFMVALLSYPKLAALLKYFPDQLRSGIFAGIGLRIFVLGFATFGLSPYAAETWSLPGNWLKWCPAYLLGGLHWCLNQRCAFSGLMVVFTIAVTSLAHIIFAAGGLTLQDAIDQGHLMGKVESAWFFEFYTFLGQHWAEIDIGAVLAAGHQVIMAGLLGPMLNVAINLVVLNIIFQGRGDFVRELRSQALTLLAGACGAGYNAYVAVSHTSILRSAGGRSQRRANAIHVLMMLAVCIAKPVCPLIVLLIPKALVGALFVYIGFSIAKGCLIDDTIHMKHAEVLMVGTIALVCLATSVLYGFLLGIVLHFVVQRYQGQEDCEVARESSYVTGVIPTIREAACEDSGETQCVKFPDLEIIDLEPFCAHHASKDEEVGPMLMEAARVEETGQALCARFPDFGIDEAALLYLRSHDSEAEADSIGETEF